MLLSLTAFAHHGTNISYDQTKPITMQGTVVDFRYTNPHPQLFFDVTDPTGKVTRWGAEIAPTPFTLQQAGWNKSRSTEALKPGTKITITVGPSRVGAPVGLVMKIVGESGQEILISRGID
jgi:hypothetical protein